MNRNSRNHFLKGRLTNPKSKLEYKTWIKLAFLILLMPEVEFNTSLLALILLDAVDTSAHVRDFNDPTATAVCDRSMPIGCLSTVPKVSAICASMIRRLFCSGLTSEHSFFRTSHRSKESVVKLAYYFHTSARVSGRPRGLLEALKHQKVIAR